MKRAVEPSFSAVQVFWDPILSIGEVQRDHIDHIQINDQSISIYYQDK